MENPPSDIDASLLSSLTELALSPVSPQTTLEWRGCPRLIQNGKNIVPCWGRCWPCKEENEDIKTNEGKTFQSTDFNGQPKSTKTERQGR